MLTRAQASLHKRLKPWLYAWTLAARETVRHSPDYATNLKRSDWSHDNDTTTETKTKIVFPTILSLSTIFFELHTSLAIGEPWNDTFSAKNDILQWVFSRCSEIKEDRSVRSSATIGTAAILFLSNSAALIVLIWCVLNTYTGLLVKARPWAGLHWRRGLLVIYIYIYIYTYIYIKVLALS